MWVFDTATWQGPVGLSPPDTAPPGAPVALIYQTRDQLTALFVSGTGTVTAQ
jgi:hypothetical protein